MNRTPNKYANSQKEIRNPFIHVRENETTQNFFPTRL